MKNKIALLAGLAAVAFSNPVNAETIRLTGSTAFRAQTHAAILADGWTQAAFTGTSASGAKYAIYTKGSDVIKTSWTGSVAGIQTVAQQRTDVKWLSDIGAGDPVVVGGGSNSENSADETGSGTAPDIGFADNAQAATIFRTPVLTNTVCGIVQFRWVTNYNSPITKINSQQARALFQSGSLPLSFFTGNTADAGKKVYGLGRDPDSGTRVISLSETGIGANSTVVHWSPTLNNTTNKITALVPWPVSTAFGITFAEGNGGYVSGGDLIKAMRYDTATVSVAGGAAEEAYLVACVGVNDVSTGLAAHNPPTTVGAGPCKVIEYENNGDSNALGSAATAVAHTFVNGNNPMWSYLNCFHNGLTGTKLTFYNNFVAALAASVSNNLSLATMNVERNSDGGVILPK
jgi:hypothetical protein